jgi:ribosome modulation factor
VAAVRDWNESGFDARLWGLVALSLLAVVLAAWWWDARHRALIVGKTWHLDIEVEQLVAESESAWCDEMPPLTRALDRRSAAQADGSARDRCRYQARAWRTHWLARAQGPASSPPHWPQPPLKSAGPDGFGAERLGKRQAVFEVELRRGAEGRWLCPLPREHWQGLEIGMRPRLAVDRFGVAQCASLLPG